MQEIEQKFHPAAEHNTCGIISWCRTCIFVIWTSSVKTA